MRYKLLFLFIFLSLLISCNGTTDSPNKTPNTAITNNPNKANSDSPLNTNKTPPPVKTSEAPNITPVVQAYYEALKKKDEAGAKKYLSAAALKYYEDEGKSEKKSWFAYVLEENTPIDETREVQNEKVEGEKATAEVKGGNLAVWTKKAFVKENGEWKFASEEENIKLSNIKKTETLSNTGK